MALIYNKISCNVSHDTVYCDVKYVTLTVYLGSDFLSYFIKLDFLSFEELKKIVTCVNIIYLYNIKYVEMSKQDIIRINMIISYKACQVNINRKMICYFYDRGSDLHKKRKRRKKKFRVFFSHSLYVS